MEWLAYGDMSAAKIEADVLSACSVCCIAVPASSMWGATGEERSGWVFCSDCHDAYAPNPDRAWQIAQDRWDSEGPCPHG